MTAKTVQLNVHIKTELKERLVKASKKSPYAISLTQIITRGITLAIEEIERKQ